MSAPIRYAIRRGEGAATRFLDWAGPPIEGGPFEDASPMSWAESTHDEHGLRGDLLVLSDLALAHRTAAEFSGAEVIELDRGEA